MNVLILGQGPRTLPTPPGHEVWVINGPTFPPRWDRLYQLHSVEHLLEARGPAFVEMLATIRPPHRLIMVDDTIANAEMYPWDRVLADCPQPWYLTHSTPLLIRHALLEGAERIVLDGFSDRPGLEHEKLCVAYHVGAARQAGAEVTVTEAYGLLPGPTAVYGMQERLWAEQMAAGR